MVPTYSTVYSDRREPELVAELLVKAVVCNGCDPLHVGDTVVAKRGMQGVSWGLEICFQLVRSTSGTDVHANGTIGGYGAIQHSQLKGCTNSILESLRVDPSVGKPTDLQEDELQADESPSSLDEISSQCSRLEDSLMSSQASANSDSSFADGMARSSSYLAQSFSMDSTTLLLTKDFMPQEKMMFMNEYNSSKKSVTTGVLLALFLGGLGIHKFWIGSPGVGVLYLLFCWTFIPAIIAIIDACLMGNAVQKYNGRVANDAYQKVMMMR